MQRIPQEAGKMVRELGLPEYTDPFAKVRIGWHTIDRWIRN